MAARLGGHFLNSSVVEPAIAYSSGACASAVSSGRSFRLAQKAAAAPTAAAPNQLFPCFAPPLPVAGSVVTVVLPW